jgi:molybdopterin-containing oxidoreductase family iron-sulfur binding subunit
MAAQVDAILGQFPKARWHTWEPAGRDHARAGAMMAFGEAVEPQHHFDQADVILSLDADFVSRGPANLRLIREFASRRRVGAAQGEAPATKP